MSDKFAIQTVLKNLHPRLKFFRDSYEGGEAYRSGAYLKPHKREKEESYKLRLSFASFRNFCAAIIDIYTAYLYRESPTRELKNLEAETEEFMKDADFEKTPFNKFIRETSKHAGKYGMMGLVIDKPKGEAKTKAEEKALGLRPYAVLYSPLQFVRIMWQRINGRPTLIEVVLEEETGDEKLKRYRIWTRTAWEVWEVDTREGAKNNTPQRKENGTHKLKEIPFVLIKNRDKFNKIVGLSDIEDIADTNRRVYNLDSYADIIMSDAGFPFLEIPNGDSEGEVQIGLGNVLEKNDQGHGSDWVEPAHTSLPNILEWRRASIEDIREMAKTGKVSGEAQQAESGIALELRFDQLNAVLTEKAENMEGAENEIFRLFGKWQNVEWDGSVVYPRKFGVRDLHHDLELAIQASAAIPSKTFDAVQGLKLAARILKDADKETLAKIKAELTTSVGDGGESED